MCGVFQCNILIDETGNILCAQVCKVYHLSTQNRHWTSAHNQRHTGDVAEVVQARETYLHCGVSLVYV